MHYINWNDGSDQSISSTAYPPKQSSPIAQGWECPRCHKINAPWASQCNCTGYKSNLYQTSITNQDQLGAINNNNNKKMPYSITLDDPSITVGGSDFYNSTTNTYENISKDITNTYKGE